MNVSKPIRQQRLRTQMTLLVLIGVFLSCFLVAVMGGENTRRSLIGQAERDTKVMLRQVIKNLEYYLDDMASLASLANVQTSVLRLLVNDAPIETDQSSYFENAQSVRVVLTDFSRLRPEITSIAIAGENGAFADTSYNVYTRAQVEDGRLSWYPAAIQSGGRSVFLPPHTETDLYGYAHNVISLTRPIIISRGAKPIGAICINLSTATLASICADAELSEGGYLFLVDEDGNFIHRPSGDALTSEMSEEIIARAARGEESFLLSGALVLTASIESANYRVCAVAPYAPIASAANSARTIQIALGALSAVLMALLIALLLSARVFTPLNRLRWLMGRVQQGDFQVRAEDDVRQDEIGELAAGFNQMTKHARQLMDENIQIEKQKRKAELDVLQSQITPHFLYNTLDSIVWMAEYKPEVAARMADALAKLFRLMLGGGADVVPLRQEIEHVRQYLTIQAMRYSSKLDYEISMEPGIETALVPKLLLQPLVENAIYHGIKPMNRTCLLKVRAMTDGDELVLMVMDDGVGMSEEELERVLTGQRKMDARLGGIGVKNIDERIHMYCPGEYGLTYLSALEYGTAVIVRLPRAGVG